MSLALSHPPYCHHRRADNYTQGNNSCGPQHKLRPTCHVTCVPNVARMAHKFWRATMLVGRPGGVGGGCVSGGLYVVRGAHPVPLSHANGQNALAEEELRPRLDSNGLFWREEKMRWVFSLYVRWTFISLWPVFPESHSEKSPAGRVYFYEDNLFFYVISSHKYCYKNFKDFTLDGSDRREKNLRDFSVSWSFSHCTFFNVCVCQDQFYINYCFVIDEKKIIKRNSLIWVSPIN